MCKEKNDFSPTFVRQCNLQTNKQTMQTKITQYFKTETHSKRYKNYAGRLLRPVTCALDKCLYKHPSIFCMATPDDCMGIYASEFIPEGTLLVLEEAYIGSTSFIATILSNRLDIAEELYPRGEHFSFHDKVCHNTWEYNEDTYAPASLSRQHALVPFISKFNHACMPNANVEMICLSKYMHETREEATEHYVGGLACYAVEDIHPFSEIFVTYGDDVGHYEDPERETFDWSCTCETTAKQRRRNLRAINRKVIHYLENDECVGLLDDLVLRHYGL